MKMIQDLTQTLSSSVRFHLDAEVALTGVAQPYFEGVLCSECEGAGAAHKYN